MNLRRLTVACLVGIFGVVSGLAAQRSAEGAPIKLSVGAGTTASTWNYGTIPEDATDGNRNGSYPSGSVWHSTDPDLSAWLQVDLGGNFYLDRIQIFPRTDANQLSVENFRLDVFDSADALVFSDTYYPTDSTRDKPWGTSELRGVYGRRVRISRLDGAPRFMTFAEFEVWGQTTPIGANIALGGTATARNYRADSLPINAIDGDINGIWGQNDTTGIGNPTNSLYHSDTNEVGNWWQVDLGGARKLDYINVFGRTDTTINASDVTLDVLGGDGSTVVLSQNIQLVGTDLGGQRYDQTIHLGGVTGQFVRITSNQGGSNFALALAEVEIFEEVAEIPAGTIVLDLADIVGGGDGTGAGGDQGIAVASGQSTNLHRPDLNSGPVNVYQISPLPFVDGVFVPDGDVGGPIDIEVSSTGLEVSGIVDSNGVSYDEIWNGNNAAVSGGYAGASRIGMHASKGITFDLDAIEAANPMKQATAFTTYAGMAHAQGSAVLYVLADGQIVDSFNAVGNVYKTMSIELPDEARFLTLLTSSNGSDAADWSYFSDPLLTLTPVPEPSGLFLLLAALPVWLVWRRRSA